MTPDEPESIDELLKSFVSHNKLANSTMERLDTAVQTLRQQLRVELAALLDDPRHPLSERDFADALGFTTKFMEFMNEHMNGTQTVKKALFTHLTRLVQFSIQELEREHPCSCFACKKALAEME